ncbi:MAG: hypothetical protein E6J74_40540 [Deltaproteobacteria bacterium]|nr:MAG: hypothetical protein E6J74_40540 [Deltaproteobacteria bacterium]
MKTSSSTAAKILHPWAQGTLLKKAQRYAEDMLAQSRNDRRFGLLSTFVLEFLGRAALAKVSPTLLADTKDWSNLYFSLGFTPTATKFIPRSIPVSTVFERLQVILPDFTPELHGFAAKHLSHRNEELHAGGNPFEVVETTWLASYYRTCRVLLTSMGESLELVFGPAEAKVAKRLIEASEDESAKAVLKAIHAHKMQWQSKTATEASKLASQASNWAVRVSGHRVSCPACSNDALLTGAPISAPQVKLNDDLIVETQEYLPSKFECIACQLKIAGLSQLSATNLGMPFTKTSTYDPAEYYAPQDQHDEYWGYEDDNNE